jgi:hypothetical protein
MSPDRCDGKARLGVLGDPEAAPAEITAHLAALLPGRLPSRTDDRAWDVDARYERLPGGESGTHVEMIHYGAQRRAEEGWDFVVCVTDMPLREGRQPLIADVSAAQHLAVVSLPGFGATRLRRRVADVVVELIADLFAGTQSADESSTVEPGLTDRDLPGPFHLVTPEAEAVDARVVASRGRWRLLVGMVRDNRPWRLLIGLRGAIVAAFAFSAFWMINPTIWQMSDVHPPLRLALISLGTVTVMSTWLVLYHRLWEAIPEDDPVRREQAVLFNASTVITLGIGVTFAYVCLLAVNFVAANIVIPSSVLQESLQRPVGITDYAKLTWLATSGASVAGALGTGFESERSVREAAYSRRERERRAAFHDADSRDGDDRGGPDPS